MSKILSFGLVLSILTATLCWAAPVEAAPPGYPLLQETTVHIVQPGDNLFRIALRYGTTIQALMAANNLSNHIIYVGQRLTIPGRSSSPTTSAPPAAGSTGSNVYIVQRGDTLSHIALRYGVTIWALVQANHLANPNWIYAGQRLVIPGAGQTGATPVISGGSKRILIDLSEQHLYAYEGNRLVYSFVASSGIAPTYTRTGEFRVQSKIPRAYGSAWNIWMPHWLGIYWAGSSENGIHALPILSNGQTLWAGYLGSPISYGCVVLGTWEAQQLYNWAEMGTPVSIRY